MKRHSPRFLSLVGRARRGVRVIRAATVLRRTREGRSPLLVDIREDHEWKRGHAPGALHIGRGILERDIERAVPDPDTEIVLYCGGGYRSSLAAASLKAMGYRNVKSMAGGWRAWRKEGGSARRRGGGRFGALHRLCLAALLTGGIAGCGAPGDGGSHSYRPVLRAELSRDGARDIREACREAGRTGRRVLVEVGGDWCIWCRRLDAFLEGHPAIQTALHRRFVLVRVHARRDQRNEKALGRFPPVAGYPHFFVLDAGGEFLHSQDTAELEKGESYDHLKLMRFLELWGTPGGS
ncbi:MAG: rhodanese-like domain-containing protein [Bacteroidota bacterium]